MKSILALIWLIAVLLAPMIVIHDAHAAQPPDLIAAVRTGDTAKVKKILQTPGQATVRDERGNTALHWAALANDAQLVSLLLGADFDPRVTNAAGATPLHYGIANEQIVRDLLRGGADPNARSVAGVTPLHAASAKPDSFASVKRLLDAGAKVDAPRPVFPAGELTALALAANAGNERVVKLLLDRGAAPGDTNGFTPVAAASFAGQERILKKLVARGGVVNFDDHFAGHALNNVFYTGHRQLAPFLIERGADLHQRSSFGEGVPAIVWSAYNETGDPTLTRLLLDRGADINEPTSAGSTALDWAMNLLQRTSDGFLANGFVKRSDCVSCHHQTLPAMAFGRARERGFPVDESSLARQIQAQQVSWSKTRDRAYEMYEPQPASPANLGYGLHGLQALRYEPDELTDAMVWYLAATQLPDGSWPDYDRRPPLEGGRITGTALTVRALRLYPQPVKNSKLDHQISRARQWLERYQPEDLNQRVFQLLGLHWAGVKPSDLRRRVSEILALQRPDGGWAPLPGLDSDAWATGNTLFALKEVGGISVSDERHRRSVDFLLRTQFADGSWWVPSRTWPFQPHFDSGFPHGKDQWISSGGTAWAVIALLNEIEPIASHESFPTAQVLMAKYFRPASESPKAVPETAETTIANAAADPAFTRDILPIFQKSCAGCHGGEKPKGDFSIESVAGLLRGGQSGEPAVVPGKPDASPLIRYVTDQLEDLEMPPLSKRAKYPALTKDEIAKLCGWIAQGANSPAGTTLHTPRK
jgi:ankyrin repeat protein